MRTIIGPLRGCAPLLAFVLFGCASTQHETSAPPPQPVAESAVPTHPEVTIHNLDSLNTAEDDFAPDPIASGRYLFFTSDRPGGSGKQDLYVAQHTTAGWGGVLPVQSLNTADNEGAPALSPDGQTMYFTSIDRHGGYGDADLWRSELRAGSWTAPANLGAHINSDSWESQPTLSPDGHTLYFSSNRPGGMGGRDIWMVQRQANGGWGEPVNLGPPINTPYDEVTPSIAQDGSTLYFSSNGHPSIGGFDVFVSHHTANGWSAPKNLGTPVNSTADDLFYTAQPGTLYAFFASNRPGGAGGLDLYSAYPNPARPDATTIVTGVVSDAQTHAPLGATITISELRTGNRIASLRSDDLTGEYAVILAAGKSYTVTAAAPDHLFYSDRFDVPAQLGTDQEDRENIELQPVSGSVRLLVYFEFNKATLTDESTADLTQVVTFMMSKPQMRVELDGHTDNVGSRDYNEKLSLDRAQAVRAYLVAHGVSGTRIVAKGFGFDQPVASNDTEQGRAQNRRVEFHVLSE